MVPRMPEMDVMSMVRAYCGWAERNALGCEKELKCSLISSSGRLFDE